MGRRLAKRAENREAILAAARQEIAEHGGGGLSMRAVARAVDLVSSAVYRYFPTREALLTELIVESYGHLGAALEAALGGSVQEAVASGHRSDAWDTLARSFRDWARSHPHEFQLIYGTPIPGYVAPPQTIPAAEAVAGPFLRVGAGDVIPTFEATELVDQLTPLVDRFAPDVTPSGAAAVLAELAALVGMVNLELAGHLVGTADPADQLFSALIQRQVATLGLRSA